MKKKSKTPSESEILKAFVKSMKFKKMKAELSKTFSDNVLFGESIVELKNGKIRRLQPFSPEYEEILRKNNL